MNGKLSVAVVSGPVGKDPATITYPFIFDVIYRLAKMGVNVHALRPIVEEISFSCGIYFHGMKRKIDFGALYMLSRDFLIYPLISLFRRPRRLYWENLYAFNVARVVEEFDVDLIHAHFAYPQGWVGLLAKRRIGKPLIVTLRGYDVNVVPEIGYGIRLNGKIDALIRRVLENADAFICVSTDLREKVLKLGASVDKTYTLLNGVDLNLFRPPEESDLMEINAIREKFGVKGDEILILNARHLKPVYGLEYLIYAAKLVVERVKHAKFIIAGEGYLGEKLRAVISNMGLEENVKLIGALPRTFMPLLIHASSIYVNTSLSDGMPPSLLEALASGKPIVSFNAGGAKDIINDGVNGFLVPIKDCKMLASRIIYLCENQDVLEEMGRRARMRAEQNFDINKRLSKLIDIYRKVISGL